MLSTFVSIKLILILAKDHPINSTYNRLDSVDDKYQSNCLAAAFSFTMLSLAGRESCVLEANRSGKILFLVVLFWGFLISVSYNAILTSVLAYSSPPAPIESLEELLRSPDYTLFFRKSSSSRSYFENAPEKSTGKNSFFLSFSGSIISNCKTDMTCSISKTSISS